MASCPKLFLLKLSIFSFYLLLYWAAGKFARLFFYVILVDVCAQGIDFESGFRLFGGLVG